MQSFERFQLDDGFLAPDPPGIPPQVKKEGLQSILQRSEVEPLPHKAYLVQTNLEEIAGERNQFFLGKRTAPVQIVASGQVRVAEPRVVLLVGACQPAHRRPQAVRQPHRVQDKMRMKAGDASVAVDERMDPGQAMMRARGADEKRFGAGQTAVSLRPSVQQIVWRPTATSSRR